jgi:threonine/homoserine/homoserine lactone efflux protein
MTLFFRGLIIGISIAAPVGPIGVLCIRRTLANGRLVGLVSGLGAATADGIYGIIAGFGITFISSFLLAQQSWFRIFGGLFLCYLGIRTFTSAPENPETQVRTNDLVSNYLSTFILTLTNPLTILSFSAIFAGLGLAQGDRDFTSAAQMVLGVIAGSALWWLFLSQSVGFFREQVTFQWMRRVNWVSGSIIFIFGILALISLILTETPL